MQSIRRLYLYGVSFVSLETVLWGGISLLRALISGREAGGASSLAGALSLILVGIPVFVLHWWLAQRSSQRDAEELSARVRAIFLYGVLLATGIPVVQNTLALVDRLLLGLLRADYGLGLPGGGQNWGDNLVAIGLNVLAGAYFYSVLRSNWRVAPQESGQAGEESASLEGEAFAETRRIYRYAWLVYGLALLVLGAQQVLAYTLETPQAGPGLAYMLANGMSWLVVGGPLWFLARRIIRQALRNPGERSSLTRVVVLYGLVFTSLGSVLVSAGMLLYHSLLFVLGARMSLAGFLSQAANPTATLIPLGAVWYYYGRILRSEMYALPGSSGPSSRTQEQRAGLRRFYAYVLSLGGLSAVLIGLETLLGFILKAALAGVGLGDIGGRQSLAAALATLAIGLPVWIFSWQPLVAEAAQPGETGDHARRSLLRKSYLFGVLFAAVLGVMFSAGALLFELIKAILGNPSQDLALATLLQLRTLLLFTLLLAYHWQVLRWDGRLAEQSLARRHARFPVLILTSSQDLNETEEGQEGFARAMAAALQRLAPALPVAVHSYDQGVPDESLSAAQAVILPAELLARLTEAFRLWLQNFSGAHIVVPTPTDGWHWVYGRRAIKSMARQAAQTVRHLAEGEQGPAEQDVTPWLPLIYILAGLFVVEIIVALAALVFSNIF